MKILVVTPHFEPDIAPTGEVVTRLVAELVARGHRIDVVTALPWYRNHSVEPGFAGRLLRREDTPWGSIARIHPFPTDKRSLARRAAAFASFSGIAAAVSARGDDADAVLALSPPLTLGVAGWIAARARKAAFVFNIQDIFPDIAVELGAITNRHVIAAARRLERFCYRRADAITALSEDLAENIRAKTSDPMKVITIPNFVDTDFIRPARKENAYRREFGLQKKRVVMYAGNVGLSQSLDLMIEAAVALGHEDDAVFVVNGAGAARPELERRARGLPNVLFVDPQPAARLPEVLAAADIHLVLLKPGLGRLSVPSKIYSILAAGRPAIASIDRGTEIERIVLAAGAGEAIRPGDAEALAKSISAALRAPDEWSRRGRAGRTWVENHVSPPAVARAYEELFESVGGRRA